MKATIQIISNATGFSPATVSNALNRKRGVSVILTAARELGYQENNLLKKIKFILYKTNGLITDDTPFFNLVMEGFQNECKRFGYEMVMEYLDRREADFERRVRNLMEDVHAVVVLVGAELMEEDFHFFENPRGRLRLWRTTI